MAILQFMKVEKRMVGKLQDGLKAYQLGEGHEKCVNAARELLLNVMSCGKDPMPQIVTVTDSESSESAIYANGLLVDMGDDGAWNVASIAKDLFGSSFCSVRAFSIEVDGETSDKWHDNNDGSWWPASLEEVIPLAIPVCKPDIVGLIIPHPDEVAAHKIKLEEEATALAEEIAAATEGYMKLDEDDFPEMTNDPEMN